MRNIILLSFLTSFSLFAEVQILDQDSCSTHQEKQAVGNLNGINKLIAKISPVDSKILWEKLKSDYQSSELCDPINNYSDQDQLSLFVRGLGEKLKVFTPYFDKDFSLNLQESNFLEIMNEMKFSENEIAEFKVDFDNLKSTDYALTESNIQKKYLIRESYFSKGYILMAKIKKRALDKFEANKNIGRTFIHQMMAKKNMIELDENKNLNCKFVDYDAFAKAFSGYQKLKGKNPNLTIVDYTRPSNSRRMFVMNMEKGIVLDNTWVAHGMGDGSQIRGTDGRGGSPKFSNDGSGNVNLSSEGFIVTEAASHGSKWGDNILLRGVDLNNTNIAKRQIVLHGFEVLPLRTVDKDAEESLKEDLASIRNYNPNDPNSVRLAANLMSSRQISDYNNATYGCLGVTTAPSPDRLKGSKTGQLQQLIRDLSGGTVIFSYSGPGMKSKYF